VATKLPAMSSGRRPPLQMARSKCDRGDVSGDGCDHCTARCAVWTGSVTVLTPRSSGSSAT
jgi:hypothetical protein